MKCRMKHKRTVFEKLLIAAAIFAIAVPIVWAASLTNPYPDGATAGNRLTRGFIVRILESNATHIDTGGGDGFVNKGDAAIFGDIGLSGVALESVDAATDYVNWDTRGIYYLSVTAGSHEDLDFGDRIYILTADGDVVTTTTGSKAFGWCMSGDGISSNTTAVIAVLLDAAD